MRLAVPHIGQRGGAALPRAVLLVQLDCGRYGLGVGAGGRDGQQSHSSYDQYRDFPHDLNPPVWIMIWNTGRSKLSRALVRPTWVSQQEACQAALREAT